MQLYATDHEQTPIFIEHALPHTDYFCMECKQIVRIRKGICRQPHFWHIRPSHACRQSRKSALHIQIQSAVQTLFSPDNIQLEKRFVAIHRIADVAYLPEHLVFEVQISPISYQEVIQRSQDYASIGWTVVWLLCQQQFLEGMFSSEADVAFTTRPHYFVCQKKDAQFSFVDAFTYAIQNKRRVFPEKSEICLSDVKRLDKQTCFLEEWHKKSLHASIIQTRLNTWPLFFGGDLLDRYLFYPSRINLNADLCDFLTKIVQFEMTLMSHVKRSIWQQKEKENLFKYLLRYGSQYVFLLCKYLKIYFIEKSCR